MDSSLLADIVVVAHLAYSGFVLVGFVCIPLGGALGWGWVRHRGLRLAHCMAIAVVGAEGLLGVVCPLTRWEFQLRQLAGEQMGEGAFIARWAARLLYYHLPSWVFTTSYVVLTLLAVGLLWLVPPRWRPRA